MASSGSGWAYNLAPGSANGAVPHAALGAVGSSAPPNHRIAAASAVSCFSLHRRGR